VFIDEVMRRSAGIYLDALREGTRLAWWGANFTLEQMQRLLGSRDEPNLEMNDATLKAEVETELFRPADTPKGRVTIGVVDGVVELRGTAKTQKQIRDLERRAREIPEVRDVENLLHQPKTPAPGRTDAPAPKRKRTASSSRGHGGARRSSPGAGKRSAPTSESRPAVSTAQARPAAGGQRPTPSTSERAAPSTGERPAPSTSDRPTPGTPERPSPSAGARPAPSTSDRPTPGTPERPSPSAGARPAPTTSERAAPSTGERPAPTTGERPTPGTGERATASASVRLRNVGAPGTAQSDPTHPRTKDVLGVLARQADSGEHVSDAEIGKELGLDVTEVADVLRTLSTTNLISRTSTGNWELTPAGEREVEPGPRPKEPRLQPRAPQAS
jgi:hypothetical protein